MPHSTNFGRLSHQRALHCRVGTRKVCVQLGGGGGSLVVGGSSSARAQVGGEMGQFGHGLAEVQLIK
jgi:hypothetical protein